MKWGSFDLHTVSDGAVWLDGGAMFGVVPRALWEREIKPDGKNRIPLGLNCLLVKTPDHNVLIDTGCGYKYSDKELEIYRIEHPTDVLKQLTGLGINPDQIDYVINTHFHFDHCGGNTREESDKLVPSFPRAEYIVRRQEFKDANEPNVRTRATYRSENWAPLVESGQLTLLEEDTEIVPGVECLLTPGHTLGHQSVKITSEGNTLFYIADLCPTMAHVPLAWIMGFDLYPMTTLDTRRKVYARAVDEDWTIFFEHDASHCLGRLVKEGDRYSVEPLNFTD